MTKCKCKCLFLCHRSGPTAPSSLASHSRPTAGPMRPVGLGGPELDELSRYTTHTLTFSPLPSDPDTPPQLTFSQILIVPTDMFHPAAPSFLFITSVSILHTSRLGYRTFYPRLKVKAFRPAPGRVEDVCVRARKMQIYEYRCCCLSRL